MLGRCHGACRIHGDIYNIGYVHKCQKVDAIKESNKIGHNYKCHEISVDLMPKNFWICIAQSHLINIFNKHIVDRIYNTNVTGRILEYCYLDIGVTVINIKISSVLWLNNLILTI